MCEFCEPENAYDGKEIVNQIGVKPIGMGKYENVFQLEAWITRNSSGENVKLIVCLSIPYGGDEIQTMEIPIKYCPNCGMKL